MTTFATGNPLGSSKPKDLSDNAENLDRLVNGPAASYPDRFGTQRKSIAGMNSEFDADQAERASRFVAFLKSSGYAYLGAYAAGITISELNQTLLKDGVIWRPSAALVLPYTTTGVWAAESSKFVAMEDMRLQDLISVSEYIPLESDNPSGVEGLLAELESAPFMTATLPGAGVWSVVERFSILRARMAAGQTVNICCFGDSTTDGQGTTGWAANSIGTDHAANAPRAYPAVLQGLLREMYGNPNINVWNAGFTGKSAADGWAYENYAEGVINNTHYGTPDICLIAFGLNDIAAAGSQVTPFIHETRKLCARMLAAGTVPILLSCDPMYRIDASRDHKESRRQIDASKSSICAELNIPYMDIAKEMKEWLSGNKDGHRWGIIQPDGLHFGDAGHRFKAAYLAKEIFVDCFLFRGDQTLIPSWDSSANPYLAYSLRYSGANLRQGANINTAGSLPVNGQAVLTAWVWNSFCDCELIYLAVGRENMAPSMTIRPKADVWDVQANTTQQSTPGMLRISTPAERTSDVPHRVGFLPFGLSRVRYIAGDSPTFFFGCFELLPSNRATTRQGNALARTGEISLTSAGNASISDLIPYSGDGTQIASAAVNETLEFLIDVDWKNGASAVVVLMSASAWSTSDPVLSYGAKSVLGLYKNSSGNISLTKLILKPDGTYYGADKVSTSDYTGVTADRQQLRVRLNFSDSGIVYSLADSWGGADVQTQTLPVSGQLPHSAGACGGLVCSGIGTSTVFKTTLHQLIWRKM